jgi:hypothetical protein
VSEQGEGIDRINSPERWVVGEYVASRPQERERTEEAEGKKEESSFVPSKQTTLICTHVMVSWFDPTELVLG